VICRAHHRVQRLVTWSK